MILVIKSILIFLLAGLCEIGGGYLVWLWLRHHKPWWFGAIGLVILGLYGVIATFQPANFGRVYAAYGGIFIVMAIFWGWQIDGFVPDKFDILGGVLHCLGWPLSCLHQGINGKPVCRIKMYKFYSQSLQTSLGMSIFTEVF